MGEALLCAECGPPVPATVLVIIPGLYQMVAPSCGRHGELVPGAILDVIEVDSPEAADYTVLRGWYVSRLGD
jgi:hypothetical protein